MDLNADFTKPVLIHGAAVEWKPSPITGVERRMLDRIGGEVARATSIVRYAPASQFATHNHEGGEEFVVLKGMFQDKALMFLFCAVCLLDLATSDTKLFAKFSSEQFLFVEQQ